MPSSDLDKLIYKQGRKYPYNEYLFSYILFLNSLLLTDLNSGNSISTERNVVPWQYLMSQRDNGYKVFQRAF